MPKILSSSLFKVSQIFTQFYVGNYLLVYNTARRHATLLPQTGLLNRLTNIDAARTQTLLTKRDPLHFDTHYRYNTREDKGDREGIPHTHPIP